MALFVMIKCLTTGAPVSTGIDTRDEWRLPGYCPTVKCAGCGKVHPWDRLTTWVVPKSAETPRTYAY